MRDLTFIEGVQSFWIFLVERQDQILTLLVEHIQMTMLSVVIAAFIGIPLGIAISKYTKFYKPVMGAVNVMQAIPTMAALGFLIPFLGIGPVPAVFMVVLYSLMPIVKNTATGLLNINKDTLEAAKAIGMTEFQILTRVQFPIALPVIMAGVRISAVIAVGLMTLASLIGAGGLGYLIYSGLQMVNTNMILGGAIPACILALLMDYLFSQIEKAVTPISLRVGIPLPDSKEKLLVLRQRRKFFLYIAASALLGLLVFIAFSGKTIEGKVVSVTCKNAPEQFLMANMISDLIEDRTDITVDRKFNMGGTQVCFAALVSGEVDIQVEYTGTIFASILAQPLSKDSKYVHDTIKTMYKERYDLVVFEDWGFNNLYALAIRQDTAKKYNLETISDLIPVADQMIFTSSFEFSNREDGLLGLQKEYPLNFKDIKPVDGGLRYAAIDSNNCDIIVANTTDSMVHKYNLKILKDDKKFFLDYFSVPVMRADTLAKYPELGPVMNILAGKLTEKEVSALNYRIEIGGESPENVSKDFLRKNGYIK